jgi:tetratricopeptide (TPR) repeat protein
MNDLGRGKIVAIWMGLLMALAVPVHAVAAQQTASGAQGGTDSPDKAQAYYHFTLGHLYQERGTLFNRPDLLSRAIEEFNIALRHDPNSSYLSLELADLYAMTGRWQNAVDEAEAAVSRSPNDATARRLLGRLYLRLLGADRRGQVPEGLDQRAIQKFERLIEEHPDDIRSYLVLAQLYRITDDNAKAEEILKRAVALDPESADATTQLALLYVELGQYTAAVSLLEKIAGENADLQVLASLGHAYEQLHDYEAAADAYGRVVERDPDNPAIRKAYGQSLLYSQQYDKALEQYQALAASQRPPDPETHLRLSQIYRFQRNFPQARQALARALDLAPDNQELQYNQVLLAEAEGNLAEATMLVQRMLDSTAKSDISTYTPQEKSNRSIFLEKLGALQTDQANLAGAEEAFQEMVDLGGDGAIRGEVRLIEIYQEMREYDKALQESERALREFPESQELLMTRASLLASSGDVEAGVKLLTPLLRNTDEDRDIWMGVAQVALRGKDFPRALEALGKAESYPQSDLQKSYIHFLYGSSWERQDDVPKAEQAFRRALELNPQSANSLNYLGYMLADRGVRLDESVELIQKALEMEPGNGAYLDSLGWAYYKLNRFDLAEKYLLESVEKVPTDPAILDHLGDLYSKTGRIPEAQQQWKKALEQWRLLPPNELEPDEVAQIEQKLRESGSQPSQ